jgi:DNA-binding transcriptional ArsR family regulator
MAISILRGELLAGGIEEFRELIQSVQPDQVQDLRELVSPVKSTFYSLLEILAWLTGVLFEEDYVTATREMRQLSVSGALEMLTGKTANDQDKLNQLAELLHQMRVDLYREKGIEPTPEAMRRDLDQLFVSLSFLRDESRALDFWSWLDRFYYENYQPWRATRQTLLITQRQMAISNLGAVEGEGAPSIGWLSEKNPLQRIPGLRAGIEEGRWHTCFWVEPFGLADTWTTLPGIVVVSIAPAGAIFNEFASYAEQLANRIQALSDPTRLIILRLIRNMGMNNTDMADYLKLARPTVSIHARILREAGLIHTYADGRAARHEIDAQAVRTLFSDMERFLDLP